MMRKIIGLLRRRSRRRRYLRIRDLTGIESLTGLILDLGGGSASFLAAMFPRPQQVILVDVSYDRVHQAKRKQSALHVIVADGGRLPLADDSVEVTVCNSVIEHVNDPDALATEIRRVSRSYFLQTPDGNFPLETHSFIAIPFYSFVPWVWLRWSMCKVFRANFEYVSSVHYLSEQKLRSLFPEAAIAYGRVFGLKKSFYVYHPDQNIR